MVAVVNRINSLYEGKDEEEEAVGVVVDDDDDDDNSDVCWSVLLSSLILRS
jgi:hypothetical protein